MRSRGWGQLRRERRAACPCCERLCPPAAALPGLGEAFWAPRVAFGGLAVLLGVLGEG